MKNKLMMLAGVLIAIQSYGVEPFVLSFKTTSIADYTSNKNILAAYITKTDGTYVDTIGLYATDRYMQYLGSWRSKSGLANKNALLATPSSADAWMGATRSGYSSPSPVVLSWDLKDENGNIVLDGDYQIHLDLGHRNNKEKHDYFVFTKDSIQSVRSKPNIGAGLFTAISVDYTPLPSTPLPPAWDEDPITGSFAFADLPYSGTLAGKATDPNGDSMTYRKTAGPNWLVVNSSGALSGTPTTGDVGAKVFTVEVADGNGGTDTATLNILVKASIWGDSTAISINFSDENTSREILAANTHAGLPAYIYTNWNTTVSANGTKGSLIDSSGTPTTASVTWISKNTWYDDVAYTDADAGVGDAQLAAGYLDDGNSGAEWTVTGIPFTSYTAVIYLSTDDATESFLPFTVNGATYSTTGNKHQYTNPNWDDSNTLVITNLSGNLVVDGQAKSGDFRGSIAGFQIIAPPAAPPVTDLTITDPMFAIPAMKLSWTGVAGQTYGVETNANLTTNGNWNLWSSGITGTGTNFNRFVPTTEQQLFYRVISK